MNKSELVKALAQRQGVTIEEATELLEFILGMIEISLACGEPVLLSNFGKFEPRTKREVTRRNPRTGEEIHVPAKRTVLFRPSPTLKGRINKP